MIESVKKLVREASEEMLTDTFEIAHKEGFANIVTTSDLAVQNFLKKGLSILLPGSGFLCEEEDRHLLGKEYTWIIDPIDGTANYSRGIDQCAVCVGLKHHEEMELAVVYLPRTEELFSAVKGQGAFLNDKPISVSSRQFGDAIMSTALPVYHKEYADICSEIIKETFPELCYLAMGRTELYFEYLLSPWDYAAASLIVTEAGGVIAGLEGNTPPLTEPSGIIAANSEANLRQLLTIIQKHSKTG